MSWYIGLCKRDCKPHNTWADSKKLEILPGYQVNDVVKKQKEIQHIYYNIFLLFGKENKMKKFVIRTSLFSIWLF